MARFSALSLLFGLLTACAVNSVLATSATGVLVARQDTPIIFPGKAVSKNYQISTQSSQGGKNQTEGGAANNGTATAAKPLNAKDKAKLTQCNVGLALFISQLEELGNLVVQIDAAGDAAVTKAVTDAKEGIKTVGEGIGETISGSFAATNGEAANDNAGANAKVETGAKQFISALQGLKSTKADVQAAVAKLDDFAAAAQSLVNACD